MRRRRKTRGNRNNNEFVSNKAFGIVILVLVMLIVLSILIIVHRMESDRKGLAKEREEIENQRLEIYRSLEKAEHNVEKDSENGDDTENDEEKEEKVTTTKAKLAIVGDILCTTDILNDGSSAEGYYFDNMFSEVKNYTEKVDYAVGTMETNFTDGDYEGVGKYNSPIEFLEAIKNTGIDLVSVAHNHILDYGIDGYNETIDRIKSKGFALTGVKISEGENQFTGKIQEINGIKIAFLSYTYGLSNENSVSEEEKEVANIYSEELVDKDFEYIKDKANYTIVIMHWGEVNNTSVSDWQNNVKDYLVEKGADIILGSHPSVVEPIELIQNNEGKDVLIAYSLGNYISSFKYTNADVEMILNVEITKKSNEESAELSAAEYIPIYVLDNGVRAENRFELKDMKQLAIDYEEGNRETISRNVYNSVVSKLRWLNGLMIK